MYSVFVRCLLQNFGLDGFGLSFLLKHSPLEPRGSLIFPYTSLLGVCCQTAPPPQSFSLFIEGSLRSRDRKGVFFFFWAFSLVGGVVFFGVGWWWGGIEVGVFLWLILSLKTANWFFGSLFLSLLWVCLTSLFYLGVHVHPFFADNKFLFPNSGKTSLNEFLVTG